MGADAIFRRRLRELIKQKYGSIDRFYLESGVSKGHVADLLRGKHSATLATVERLAKALDVEFIELFLPGKSARG